MSNFKLATIINLSNNIKEECCHTTEQIMIKENTKSDEESSVTNATTVEEPDQLNNYECHEDAQFCASDNISNEIQNYSDRDDAIEYIDTDFSEETAESIITISEIVNKGQIQVETLENQNNNALYIYYDENRLVNDTEMKLSSAAIQELSPTNNVNKTKLEKHIMKGSAAQRQCEECGRVFSRKSTLDQHQTTHTGIKHFSCTSCHSMFTRKAHLRIHMRIHDNIKPYVCEVCQRGFIKSSDLLRHRRIHSDEKNFECKVCAKRFKRSADVLTHMRSHSGLKPYNCNFCDKSYSSHSSLKKHKLGTHK